MNKGACESYRRNFPAANLRKMDVFDFMNSKDVCRVDVLHISPLCQYWSPAHTPPGKSDDANLSVMYATIGRIDKIRPMLATIKQTFGLVQKRVIIRPFQASLFEKKARVILPYTRSLLSARISGNIYDEIRSVLKARLELWKLDFRGWNVIADVRRVLFSLKRLGRPIYGFDGTNGQTSRVNRANRPSGTSQ
ncbi:hypothetical protein DL769_000368 [Monosporascus sp. CRB-8-3]|nr:hypothetical protein DL769_000368 [Monosporascus sp. CRB-8-3]